MSSSKQSLRYVPVLQSASLAADAPGYAVSPGQGPICWKCRGSGNTCGNKNRKKGDVLLNEKPCAVCKSKGRLEARSVPKVLGKITRGRKSSHFYHTSRTPVPAGYSTPIYGDIVQRATRECLDVEISQTEAAVRPVWLPCESEELCNLVGQWRILQRLGSHRWTTDDLVTAAVAAKELLQWRTCSCHNSAIRYCDLGTGNASVLQMVLHQALMHQLPVQRVVGLEARSEAVGLARRSLEFNLGTNNSTVSIVHTDFRNFDSQETFDLITGTPPYFRVVFEVQFSDDSAASMAIVQTATIQQGGMPSAVQSAPARCEFRGGVEAYCEAAARYLSEDGIFCMCENFKNHTRAMNAFAKFGLAPSKIYRVEGKEGRGALFCVYVLHKTTNLLHSTSCETPQQIDIAVRDKDGAWTKDYITQILDFMSIPSGGVD